MMEFSFLLEKKKEKGLVYFLLLLKGSNLLPVIHCFLFRQIAYEQAS